MTILADLGVGLGVEMRSGDQHTELAVSQPRDEPAGLADAHPVTGGVALDLQRELNSDRVRGRAKKVIADGVSATIAPRPGHIDLVDLRLAHLPQVRGEPLKIMRPVLEPHNRLVARRPGLLSAWQGGPPGEGPGLCERRHPPASAIQC
jgi:hypothetical protein